MTNWKNVKYFTKGEFVSKDTNEENMDPRLIACLDVMRETIGESLHINSGYRTPEYNKKIGGHPNSSHMKGLAVDIDCRDDLKRWKIISFATSWNSTTHILRILIYKTFLHLDIDNTKPNPAIKVMA